MIQVRKVLGVATATLKKSLTGWKSVNRCTGQGKNSRQVSSNQCLQIDIWIGKEVTAEDFGEQDSFHPMWAVCER